jgi:hypothetical protein
MRAALVDDAGGIRESLERATNVDEAIDEQLTSLIWHYGAGQGCDDLVCLVIGT